MKNKCCGFLITEEKTNYLEFIEIISDITFSTKQF